MPGSTTDLAIPYALPADPRAEWPATNLTMSDRIAALLRGVQFSIGDGLTGDGSVAAPLKAALSGIWGQNLDGNAPLDIYGPISQTINAVGGAGQSIYLDANGELRAPPLVISGPDVNRLNADPVGVYPLGPSVLGLSTALAGSGGWPLGYSATVLTNKRDMDVANQLWFQNTRLTPEIKIKYRSGDLNGWTAWVDLYSDSGWVPITILPAFGVTNAAEAPSVRLKNGIVYARGAWSNAGIATANTSYIVGTIPAGYRPIVNTMFRAGTHTGSIIAGMYVYANGEVHIRTATSPFSSYYFMSGVSWPID